jgi:hypothetical protein
VDFVQLRLRQRIEGGSFMRAFPELPEDLQGRWDGFVDARGLVFCLKRRVGAEDAFDAVTCFERACLGWVVAGTDAHGALATADVIVETPEHVIARYVGRVRDLDARQARSELHALISTHAQLMPELPRWFAGETREDAPYFLVLAGWLVLPLWPKTAARCATSPRRAWARASMSRPTSA